MIRKCFVLGVFCVLIVGTVTAQTTVGVSDALSFRSSIEGFLREEGYVPTIDDNDESVNFKKEGELYWITVQGSDVYYIRFYRNGYDSTDDLDHKTILDACNYANSTTRCAKAWVTDVTIGFTVEFYCHAIEAFRNTFYSNMRALDRSYNTVTDYYNEHEND